MIKVNGFGPPSASLFVIGEAPGTEETNHDPPMPFIGKSGQLTRSMLREGGIDDSDVYFDNVEKYQPPGNSIKRLKDIGKKPFEDLEELWKVIEERKPNCILGLGQHALRALTGKPSIKLWRGSILTTLRHNIKFVGTYHTSNLVRSESSDETQTFDYSARAYMQLDFERSIQESRFSELVLPSHKIEICRSAEHLDRFLAPYINEFLAMIDIETARGSSIPICVGIAFNSYHGMCVPLLPHKDWKMDDFTRVRILKRLQEFFLSGVKFGGQNIKFDLKRLRKSFGFKFPEDSVHFDVGMAAHVLYPEFPKKLEFLTSVWTRVPYYKDELKEFDPHTESIERVFEYNVKDVCVPYEIYEKELIELKERNLDKFFFEKVMPLHEFYMTMEMNGLSYNRDTFNTLKDKYREMKKELNEKLDKLIGYKVNFKSWPQVHKLLYKSDLKLPWRSNTQEDTLVALLANHTKPGSKEFEILNGILDLRKINRTLDAPLSAKPDYDGKMRTLFNINGAATGRTSCNILKAPERPTKVGIQGQNLTKHGTLGADLRRIIIPSRGKILLQADKRQAEAYVTASLSRDSWTLRILREGKDIHSIVASWFFNKENPNDPENPIGITPNERFIGKTGKHMLNYKAGEIRLMREINTNARKFGIPVNVSQGECREYRRKFFAKSPRLERIYYPEVEECIRDNKTLRAASGRERIFFGFWDPNLYYAYIPQASVGDDTKFAGVRIHKRLPWLEFLLEGHDSLLVQCSPVEVSEVREIMKEEMEKPMELDRCSLPRDPLVIPCDFEIGDNYKDLEKIA